MMRFITIYHNVFAPQCELLYIVRLVVRITTIIGFVGLYSVSIF